MPWDDDPRDIPQPKPPECSYWGDGEHHWYSNDTPDYRYTNHPMITLKCNCGVTKEEFD